jgi:uncharacterized protein (DUF952 family)
LVRVFKILAAAEWRPDAAAYAGSADDRRDGFIHLSIAAQLRGVLVRHFRGRGDLLLLEIDAAALGDPLKWEASHGGELFPHLYAPLPLSAVRSATAIAAGSELSHIFA